MTAMDHRTKIGTGKYNGHAALSGGLVLGGFLSAGIGFVNAAAAMALQRDAINGLVISVANLRDTILNAARPDSCR